MARTRLTFRRLSGLDRSGPPPPETRPGAPLRPWTIPNAIGFVRLALIPAFLAIEFSSDDGVTTAGVTLFGIVAWSDYADGIAARVTGQYSRLGTLLDPVVDRLLVISGIVVSLYFDLLPRWAVAVLVAREALMLVLGEVAVRRSVDLPVNWPGRIAVWPTMTALFLGLLGWRDVGAIMLYIGLFFSWWAFALYARSGIRQLRERRHGPSVCPEPSTRA